MESSVAKINTLEYLQNEKHPGCFVNYCINRDFIEVRSDNATTLRLYILESNIIRFRYSVSSIFLRDFSYAIDPDYKPSHPLYEIKDLKSKLVISTSRLKIEIYKENLFIHIFDHLNNLLSSDEKGFHWEDDLGHGGQIVKMSKYAQKSEAYFGLGDKPTDQNLRGKRFSNWGTDEFGYHKGTDPLYKNINLIYSLLPEGASAIYFDNSFKTHFDLGCERDNILSYWADGGEMNYYFIGGGDLMEVAQDYAKLTGRPDMPPLWALGYQQSKWSYFPENQVKDICTQMRAEKIPCDAIYLDIDYMDGFRCFTWNNDHFPDPVKMISDLKEQGFKTIAIIDPGIKIDAEYEIFQKGLENDVFCRRTDGPYVQGKVWPGECYFPDFTNPKVREWWAGLFQSLIEDIDLDGIWNDMNEPAIFDTPTKTFPLDVRHDYDGNPCSHRKAHNIYGMQMARATAEGVKRFAGNRRKLIISRSGFAGMQRFTSVWTGDNLASWEHLELAHHQTVRLSISGVSFCGSDVGGFIDQADGELFVRWMQLAIFHPFFRNHSSGDHGDQEPWSFGEKYLNIVRSAIELRYRLLPYFYTCFYEYHKKGSPILRPLTFDSSVEKPLAFKENEETLLGNDCLFSPVLEQGAVEKIVELPEGLWYDYFENKVFKGNEKYKITTELHQFPFFIRGGAIIPHFPLMQYVGEKTIEQVTLKVYFVKGKYRSNFYIDDLDGLDYQKNNFRYSQFLLKGSESELNIEQSIEGSFYPSYQNFKIEVIGLSSNQLNVMVDNQYFAHYEKNNENIVHFVVDRDFKSINIEF